jgi:predicted secreted protein
MSNAISGVGTNLYRWDADLAESSGGGWVKYAEVKNISGPNLDRELIDVTSLDSTAGYREFITGIRTAGELTFSMNFTRANLELLLTDFESDDVQDYRLLFPDTEITTWEFQGFIKSFPPTFEVASAITLDVTMAITGAPTLSSGGSEPA